MHTRLVTYLAGLGGGFEDFLVGGGSEGFGEVCWQVLGRFVEDHIFETNKS